MSDTSSDANGGSWWKRFRENSISYSRPDPWIRRKIVVLFVLALTVWEGYVAIGRTFVPAIQHRPGAAYSSGVGIGLLVAFLILYIMFVWSYLAIIFTGPGFAKAFVEETEDPSSQSANVPHSQNARLSESTWLADPSSQGVPSRPDQLPHLYQADQSMLQLLAPPAIPAGHELPMTFTGSGSPRESRPTDFVSFSDRPSQTRAVYQSTLSPSNAQSVHPVQQARVPASSQSSSTTPVLKVSRIPRPTPLVSSEPRWCRYCRIIKPDRTHHCRHCGTCILQFDHHCVWVGQCVGWRNHAVFITFCFWAGVFCLFSTAVLVVDSCLAAMVDGQKIALITISGILFIFTLLMMLPTHVYLILVGRSTIESFKTGTQQQAEEAALKLEFNNPACPTKDVRTVRKEWREEYGGVAVNDRWRVGRARDRWMQEMGKSPIGWVLPIGRPLGDGIHYEQNPRFGPNGEWLPMRQWPSGVARK